jgi:hypothetical protein
MKAMLSILVLGLTVLSMRADAGTAKLLVYQKGDEVPINFTMEGDLAETNDDSTVYVTVKRTFFLKLADSGTLISFDGINYKPYQQVIKQNLIVQALGDDPAPVSIVLNASIK